MDMKNNDLILLAFTKLTQKVSQMSQAGTIKLLIRNGESYDEADQSLLYRINEKMQEETVCARIYIHLEREGISTVGWNVVEDD